MLPSKKIFKYLIFVTLLVFIYVHQQIAILRVSYSIEKKEREVARLSEDCKTQRYQLTRLKSPRFLDRQMKQHSLNLTTPKVIEVIKVPAAEDHSQSVQNTWPAKSVFLSWVGSLREAQAKTSK